jgi:N-methylhydantoinase A
MAYLIGIDIGGTFTDAVAADSAGRLIGAKTPSTPHDYAEGVFNILDELAQNLGLPRHDLLGETEYIAHGTTAALNALVTGNVAKVGFLTTRGHGDSLAIMNLAGRYAGLDSEHVQAMVRTNKPPPLVTKSLIREINERVDYKGSVIVPLDEAQARRAVGELLDQGVEALAISLLWSFRNPAHEERLAAIVREMAPALYVGLSSLISPRIREYPRNVTTVMSAMVAPRLDDYLVRLESGLNERGFRGSLLVMQGSGQTVRARDATQRAIGTIGSVLTGGAIGAQRLAHRLGHRQVISTDLGGTTFLVGLIVDGEPTRSTSTILNQHTINVPTVDIATIGAGGGAIAWVDQGGNLRVGPRSAGAAPGPACYETGGTEPTVTDANLVLGILDPDYFLGGRRKLSKRAAEEAIRNAVATPLRMSVEDAAAAIRAIQDEQTADLIRRVVVNAGHDPRDFTVYAFGGGGPAHCASNTADLNVKEVVVPLGPTAAAFSAFGLAAADVGLSEEISLPANYPVPLDQVNAVFAKLEARLGQALADQELEFKSVSFRREIDIRYSLQLAEVSTPVKTGVLDEADMADVVAQFEAIYERLFGKDTGFRDAGFQFMTYRVFATGAFAFKPDLPAVAAATEPAPAPIGTRRAFLDVATGWVDAALYDYGTLRAGHRLAAPAIVQAPTTTVVIPHGHQAVVDALGNLVITKVRS